MKGKIEESMRKQQAIRNKLKSFPNCPKSSVSPTAKSCLCSEKPIQCNTQKSIVWPFYIVKVYIRELKEELYGIPIDASSKVITIHQGRKMIKL